MPGTICCSGRSHKIFDTSNIEVGDCVLFEPIHNLLVDEIENRQIGFVKFIDIQDNHCEFHIYIKPNTNLSGYVENIDVQVTIIPENRIVTKVTLSNINM